MIDRTTPGLFLAALSLRDFDRLADCMAPQADAQILLPSGPERRSGRDAIARQFEDWFECADEFVVLDSGRESIGYRDRLAWRFRMSRDGRAPEVIDQVAFVDLGPDGIAGIDLLSSGFLPDEASR